MESYRLKQRGCCASSVSIHSGGDCASNEAVDAVPIHYTLAGAPQTQ